MNDLRHCHVVNTPIVETRMRERDDVASRSTFQCETRRLPHYKSVWD